MSSTIGELRGIKDSFEVEWRINDFFGLLEIKDAYYHSPIFDFAGASWYLRIYPNGQTKSESVGSIQCYLFNSDSNHPVTLTFTMGLKRVDGKIDEVCSEILTFSDTGYGCKPLISLSELLDRKADLAPSNTLTVICKVTQDEPTIVSTAQRIRDLSNDLRKLMLNGNNSDLTVRIKEREFKLHKNILEIRSPSFASFVTKALEERSDGIVDIDVYDESVFAMFLEYIYTGTVTDVLQKNSFTLYELAKEYEVEELKEDCLKSIKDSLSIETFFDTVALAEKHKEEELKSLTSKFCSDNLKDLVKNENWLSFMEENAKKAYELLTTALDKYKKA